MTEILELSDGTELYGYAENQNGKLYLYIHGKTLSELETLLQDSKKVSRIISCRNDGTHVYDGFTRMTEILVISDQFVTATMEN